MDPTGPHHPSDPARRRSDPTVAGRVVARVEGEGSARAPEARSRGRVRVLPPSRGGQDVCAGGGDPYHGRVADTGPPVDHGGVTPQGKVYSLVRPKSLNG